MAKEISSLRMNNDLEWGEFNDESYYDLEEIIKEMETKEQETTEEIEQNIQNEKMQKEVN